MKLIPLLLLIGMFAISGWAEGYYPEPYSAELAKKAEEGDAMPQSELGICYQNGLVVTKDNKEAMKWYPKACEEGLRFPYEKINRGRKWVFWSLQAAQHKGMKNRRPNPWW
jgi:TPR repeat protein